MKKSIIAAIILLLGFFPALAKTESSLAQALKKKIESQIKSSKVNLSHLGLYVAMTNGEGTEIVYELNAQKKMIPASITKIATASTVLNHFLPGTKFKTQILAKNEIKQGVLKGPIYLKGGGDPSFVSENLWFLVNNLRRTDLQSIEGDIIVDDSLFDEVRYDESRQEERVDRAYDAPVGAMSFNWNSVNIFIRPGEVGEPGRVFLDPENDYFQLVNKTKTSSGDGQNLTAERKIDKEKLTETITVTGKIGKGKKEHVIYKSVTRPDLWAGMNLKSFLKQRGITVTGQIKRGQAPETAQILAESESKPIEDILVDMNKFSNNYVAEMLCKNLGALNSKPATLSAGMKLIQKHMQSLSIPEVQFELQNPSGLTRDNKMSAAAMGLLLAHLRRDFRVQPEFLRSLPIAGTDGTLKKRMTGPKTERWVRAKTGLLTGVVALAGYAGREDGQVINFVFIANQVSDEGAMRSHFDQWASGLSQ